MVKTDSWLSPAEIPPEWRGVLLDVPGYDSIATAGDCMFDAQTAQTRLDFFPEMLKHVKGDLAGKPFILERWEQENRGVSDQQVESPGINHSLDELKIIGED